MQSSNDWPEFIPLLNETNTQNTSHFHNSAHSASSTKGTLREQTNMKNVAFVLPQKRVREREVSGKGSPARGLSISQATLFYVKKKTRGQHQQ